MTTLRLSLAGLLAALTLSACKDPLPMMNDTEKQQLQPYLDNLRPRCVGRYVVDLPGQMEPGFPENMSAEIDNVTLTVTPMAKHRFDSQLERRWTALKQLHLLNKPTEKALDEVINLPDGSGKIFNRTDDDSIPSDKIGRTFELHGWKNGYSISMKVDATDMSYVPAKDLASWQGIQSNTKQKLAQLLEMYRRVRGRAIDEVPVEPGLCFNHGFMAGPSAEKEELHLTLVTKDMTDVKFYFGSSTSLRSTIPLLELLDEEVKIGEGLAKSKQGTYKLLHAGKRKSKYGFAFEEMLDERPTDETTELWGKTHVQGHLLKLQANGGQVSSNTPWLNVMLFNGERQSDPRTSSMEIADNPWPAIGKASLSEAQAIALWEAITNTLRPRPNGF